MASTQQETDMSEYEENKSQYIKIDDSRDLALSSMRKTDALVNEFLNVLINSGQMAPKHIEAMHGSKLYEKFDKQQEARKKFYHNTEELLLKHAEYKKLENEWTETLAKMLDMEDEGYTQSDLINAIRDACDFERPGYKHLAEEYARMNTTQSRLTYMECGLQILKSRRSAEDKRHYKILKNAFLDKLRFPNAEKEFTRLKSKYKICQTIQLPTYYKYRRDAINELSNILYSEDSTNKELVNMAAVILCELGNI